MPRKTGREEGMKESCDEGIGSHIGPKFCTGIDNGTRGSLTGGSAPMNGDVPHAGY